MKKSRKKRGRTNLAPTALVTPRKRPAKASEQSPGYKTAVLPALERGIVLDRLGKEILPLFKAARDRVRRRLRFGINEVTRFLEGKAAVTSASHGNRLEETTPSPTIVLICNDVKPTRLVEHLHGLVALTGTPHLVLQGASHSLGRMFGCKTMAAFAIGPPSLAQQKQNKVDLRGKTAGERTTKSGGSEPIGGVDIDDRRGEAENDPRDDLLRAPGQKEEKNSSSDSTREGLAETRESERHPVDDDIDSFVNFLKQKCRAKSSYLSKK